MKNDNYTKEAQTSNFLNYQKNEPNLNKETESKSNQVINKKRYRGEEDNQEPIISSKNMILDSGHSITQIKRNSKITTESPYLGTIKRHLLDFDFEKVCSITLSNLNVYACLICGKYYQGRGMHTLAYSHSLEENHYMFINLSDQKVYTLPDGYEVINNSLNDIKYNLKPKFTKEDVDLIDKNTKFSKSLDGTEYLPGCIGLNNLKKTDYFNVIIQTLCRIPTLRNFFLNYDDTTTDLVRKYLKNCRNLI